MKAQYAMQKVSYLSPRSKIKSGERALSSFENFLLRKRIGIILPLLIMVFQEYHNQHKEQDDLLKEYLKD